MKRRQFIKVGSTGLAALVVGSQMPWLMDNPAYAAVPVPTIRLTITDAIKHMVTDQTLVAADPNNPAPPFNPNGPNDGTCYFWIYQDSDGIVPPECPGPIIFTTTGTRIQFTITNTLNEPHCLAIPALRFTTGPIAPGKTVTKFFVPRAAGTYLYYDNLNAPVNRVMGLHGAFIVMPKAAVRGHRFTPYDRASKNIQNLFDDLGHASWWPGLAWEQADPANDTPAFRQNIWVMHQASPNLFAEVGLFSQNNPGHLYPADQFVQSFLKPPFSATRANGVPQYFTISGQSGHMAHNNPWICPYSRVGEPYLIRLLNAGLWLHSTHIHANHVFVLQHNNKTDVFPGSLDNPIWIDVYTANPLDTYDWLIPYMRPPDVPNNFGIGRDDLETSLTVTGALDLPGYGVGGGDIPAGQADTTWPPLQEIDVHIPQVGQRIATSLNNDGTPGLPVDCSVRLSPVCFPMHDHSEPSQTSQGGNYNCGLISGIVFTGDRRAAVGGPVVTFPDRPTTGDPGMPVVHGPDIEPKHTGTLTPAPPFVMPSLP